MEPSEAPIDDTDLEDHTERSLAGAKWGKALDAGFQIVPNVLLRGQAKLGLDPLDVVILLNIALHWWQRDDLPFPQPRVIANRAGVSIRTIERRLEDLERRGFLRRLAPEKSRNRLSQRRIDLGGLVERLQEYATTNLARRAGRGEVGVELET